jgi:hypothetical protein
MDNPGDSYYQEQNKIRNDIIYNLAGFHFFYYNKSQRCHQSVLIKTVEAIQVPYLKRLGRELYSL